ncbi:hypothetical protein NP493_685g00024 [Ridgeia piscesae]|uniref:Uncharacterized protein n=1 Tax=Ridgeia piscesae TaxID=27915 RepID=A0AAD9KQY8_RIDPI|nr:hypothetical protein NP493_685g00024 [Ridgeia piscesae]
MPPECNYVIMDGLHNLCKQALQNDKLRREDVEKLSIVLRTVSLLASYEEEPKGLTQLLDKGLTNMILDILVATLRCENDRADSGVDQFLEDILEVIGAVSDYSTKAKSYVVETFCNTLLQIVISVFVRFITKMETLKTINIILEGCPLYAREKMKASPVHKELMYEYTGSLYFLADYEFQVGIIEALFRLSNRTDRETFARGCFTNKDSLEAFFQIRDSDFETDCRRFLNILNEKNTQKFRVISIPCRKACLGDYELVKPADTNYHEFWVDFNTGSKRISLFCNPETPLSQVNIL